MVNKETIKTEVMDSPPIGDLATLGLPTRTAKGDGHCSGPSGVNGHVRFHPPATQISPRLVITGGHQ